MPPASTTVLEPFRSSRLDLQNRLAFVATVTNLSRNTEVSDDLIAYYAARARGGAGMVVTEGLSVHPTSIPNGAVPLAYDPSLVPGFRRLADACHEHGTAVFGQLWHVGRQALWNPTLQPWAPSGGRDPYSGVTARTMTDGEVRQVIDGFVTSAANLHAAGFDGVELHGAHGYLITQFLSPWSNHRDDAWGGDTARRTAFVGEVVRGIRAACGNDFAVGLKISAHEYVEGGIDLAEAQRIVGVLREAAPPDYLAVSQANFSPSLEYHVPDLAFDDMPFVHLTAGVREVAGDVPVMALAKIPDVAAAERLVTDEVADLVGMARPWVADADLVRKAEEGRRPRPCTYCNICWDFIHTGRRISCMYAPEAGRERTRDGRVTPLPDPQRGTVRVIGAGLAGLEAARTAALRGHSVHLYEADDAVGGRLRRDAATPGRERMGLAVEWLEDEVRSAGAKMHLGATVTDDDVASWPDDEIVVIATGATPVPVDLPGASTVTLEDAVARAGELSGPLVVVDELEDEPVYAFATARAEAGDDVVLLTRREAPARRVAYVSRIGTFRRLDAAGVVTHTLLEPVRVQDGELVARHVYSGQERVLGPVGTVVTAGPAAPADHPDGPVVVGDASSPRSYVAIDQEAHDVVAALTSPNARNDQR